MISWNILEQELVHYPVLRLLLPLGVPNEVRLLPLDEWPAILVPFIVSLFNFSFLPWSNVSIDNPLVGLFPSLEVHGEVSFFLWNYTLLVFESLLLINNHAVIASLHKCIHWQKLVQQIFLLWWNMSNWQLNHEVCYTMGFLVHWLKQALKHHHDLFLDVYFQDNLY